MKIMREYKKRKIGEHRYITFKPDAGTCLFLDREAKKRKITVSALLREIITEYETKKGK